MDGPGVVGAGQRKKVLHIGGIVVGYQDEIIRLTLNRRRIDASDKLRARGNQGEEFGIRRGCCYPAQNEWEEQDREPSVPTKSSHIASKAALTYCHLIGLLNGCRDSGLIRQFEQLSGCDFGATFE